MILTIIFLAVALWRTYRTAKKNNYEAMFWTGIAAVVFIVSQALMEIGVMFVCYMEVWGLSMQYFVENFTLIKLISLIVSFLALWFTVGWRISIRRIKEATELPLPPVFGDNKPS